MNFATVKSHQETHLHEKPYISGMCKVSFKHETSLLLHIEVHVKRLLENQQHVCPDCKQPFRTLFDLEEHHRVHTPLRCSVCENDFVNCFSGFNIQYSDIFCRNFFFSEKFQHICVSLDVNFNDSLPNDIVGFEQLGPELFKCKFKLHSHALLVTRQYI